MKPGKVYETIIVLALVLLIGFVVFEKKWLVYACLGLLALPLLSGRLALGIAKIWFAFSDYLGLVVNFVIMFICFYFFLVPLSFFQRIFGKNQISKKQQGDSYFHSRNHLFTREDIDKPW